MLKKFFLSLIVLISLSLPAYAAVGIPPEYYPEGLPTITGAKPTGVNSTMEEARNFLTSRFVNVLLAIAGVVAIFSILNNAWYLSISAGKEETITQHKKGLMWAIVGLIFIILSFSIIRFIITLPSAADEPAIKKEGQTEQTGGKLDKPSTEPGDFSSPTPKTNPSQPSFPPEDSSTDLSA